ncbi:MAG: FtsX-like permease family protein [Bacteroidaceae bacterium]|nr:FtsX-like permease family protein [Bacteroidaceae bacterium]
MILTLKNLWTRRRQHVWLCVELVLISVVSWFVIDPLFVEVYDIFVEPDGFDTSSLCCLRPMNDYDDVCGEDSEALEKDLNVIKNKIQAMDEVESLCFETSWILYLGGNILSYVSIPGDTTKSCFASIEWKLDGAGDFFKTYGYKVIAGNPNEDVKGAVITRSVAEKLYGKTDVCGATISIWHSADRREEEYVDDRKVIAVIEDVKLAKSVNCRHSIFCKATRFSAPSIECILVRLKAGVDADAFCERLRPTMQKELSSGKMYVCEAETFDNQVTQSLRFHGYTGYLRRYISLAVFFMFCLCLGTIGTFWLQTRKRQEEIGVRRSFGASRLRIMGEFLTEGFVLTTICHIVGCFLFLQYAISFGLSRGLMGTDMPLSHINDSWLNHFAPHFLAVGTFIYLIILLTVSIGILIPAWNIVRTKPVEALRDE